MISEICAVTNVVSHSNIRTSILLPDRAQMARTARGSHAPPIIFNGLLRDVQFEDFTPHTVWQFRYFEQENMTISHIQKLNGYLRNDFKEFSPIEALDVAILVDVLTGYINAESILNNIRILLPYHLQCDLVSTFLRESYPRMDKSIEDGLCLLENCVGMVT